MVRPAQPGSPSSVRSPFPQVKPVSGCSPYLCTCVHPFCDPKSHWKGSDENTDVENRAAMGAWEGVQGMSWVSEEIEVRKRQEGERRMKEC